MVAPAEFVKQWRSVVVSLFVVLGGFIFCLGAGSLLFGLPKMLAGAGAVCAKIMGLHPILGAAAGVGIMFGFPRVLIVSCEVPSALPVTRKNGSLFSRKRRRP